MINEDNYLDQVFVGVEEFESEFNIMSPYSNAESTYRFIVDGVVITLENPKSLATLRPRDFQRSVRDETLRMVLDLFNMGHDDRMIYFGNPSPRDIIMNHLDHPGGLSSLWDMYETWKKSKEREKKTERKPKEMTVSEIEKALGYKVKIVGDKK